MRKIAAVALFSFFSFASHAEFDMLSKRYITAYDFQNRLVSFFGDVYPTHSNLYQCNEGLKKFGFSQPASGQPLSHEPNVDTIKAISECFTSSFANSAHYLTSTSREKYIKFLGQFIPQSVLESKLSTDTLFNSWHYRQLQLLTKEEQDMMVAQMVENFLGVDEVILSYGIIKDVNAYRSYLQSKLKQSDVILEAIKKLAVELALRDEFLTY